MRRDWRKVLAFGVLFLAGVASIATAQDVRTDRHGLGPQSAAAVDAIDAGLALLAEEATAP